MEVELIWDVRAVEILNHILTWQSEHYGQKFAAKFYEKTAQIIRKITLQPQIGKVDLCVENDDFQYRTFAINRKYRVIYTFNNDVVNIIYILDCRRNTENIFQQK